MCVMYQIASDVFTPFLTSTLDVKRPLKWFMVVLLTLRADCSLVILRVLTSEPIFPYGAPSRAAAQFEQGSQGSPLRFDERAPTTVPTACAALTSPAV